VPAASPPLCAQSLGADYPRYTRRASNGRASVNSRSQSVGCEQADNAADMTRKKGDGKATDTRYQSPLESQRRATQEQTFAMNLTVLQRMDPTVMEICDMAGHAVVYKFDLGAQGWSKLDIEGSLFIVRRMSGYRLIVLNRSGIENYELDITAGTLVQLQGPYLMCRASQAADVIGFWFYKEDEHASISRLVQGLVNHCQNGGIPHVPPGAPAAHPSPSAPAPPGRPPLPPQASAAAAADQAGADLRGMLGIGGAGAGVAGGGHASPPLDAAAAQATNELMSMLNIGGPAAGAGGAAAATATPLPPSVQTHALAPQQAPAPQPPSPGANIMAMLGVGGGGSAGAAGGAAPAPPPPGGAMGLSLAQHPPPPRVCDTMVHLTCI
jgi:hypothetical protein